MFYVFVKFNNGFSDNKLSNNMIFTKKQKKPCLIQIY